MARNIKIELELPEFERDLNISVTLHRDGEVITASSSPEVKTEIGSGVWKQTETANTTTGTAWKQQSGNLMDGNF